jgi:membrane-bound ClpP family serine protease
MPALSAFTEESVNVFKSIQMLSQKNKTFCNEISKFMKVASNEQKNNLLTFLFVNSNYVADNADALKNELKNYESKKVVELKQICKSLGLKSVGNNSKAELIERIQIEKIDYESLDSNYIESFQEWSKPFLSICSHS